MSPQHSVKSENGCLVFTRVYETISVPLGHITDICKLCQMDVKITAGYGVHAESFAFFVKCDYEKVIGTYRDACRENNIITPFFNKIEAERVMWDMDNMIPEASDVGLSECKRFFTFRGKKYLKVSSVMSFTGFSDATIVRLGHEEIWHIKFEDLCGLINQSK